ncbi:MAG: branched-chain amino acid transport system II carrier protein [Chlamydiia bacterium]|nr:branched-chain amino acid transport system II carrier protein [Chlamydiia bacterium]
MKHLSSFGIGLAIFSMFFGAGNSIFPIFVGCSSKGLWHIALLGLASTAVIMPILGILGVLRASGSPLLFFGRIGKTPGLIMALIVISLLGPLGSTPRCIALSYATLISEKAISMPLFALLACLLIFFCSLKKRLILPIIGYVLTPILLLSLVTIILVGLLSGPIEISNEPKMWPIFTFGVLEGYKTMDLLAAFFFSSTIFQLLSKRENARHLLIKGGLIGGALLVLVYGGFCLVASIHSQVLSEVAQEQLLAKLAQIVLGPRSSLIVRTAIALACLTTAIALITSFTDFLRTTVFKKKVSYPLLLALSLCLTYCVAIFEFASIARMLTPLLQVIYPLSIALTLINCFWNRKPELNSLVS